MRFLKYLQEEYVNNINTGFFRSTEVFNFPDRKELKDMKDVRWLIDIDNKKFYVWDGNSPLIHALAAGSLNISKKGDLRGLGSYNSATGKINISKKMTLTTSSGDINKIYANYGNLGNIGGKLRKSGDFLNKILRYFDDSTKAYFLEKLKIK
jgi:hypothetical protein